MRIYGTIALAVALLTFSTIFRPQVSTAAPPQVTCSTVPTEEILHCDVPSDASLTYTSALQVVRPANYHCYREPSIVVNRKDGTHSTYPISSSTWEYNSDRTRVRTTFSSNSGAVFFMRSTTGFSPLNGYVQIGGQKISFNTCGKQTTSAYYWTRSSQNPLEAFTCPTSGQPAKCPGIGYNP